MQQEPTETLKQVSQTENPELSSHPSSQHGSHPSCQPAALDGLLDLGPGSASPRSARADKGANSPDTTQNELRRLRADSHGSARRVRPAVPGQRVSDYERTLISPTARQALGFKVTRRLDSSVEGALLTDLPNEILTHVLSHLHPDSHAAIALVSKRFYALVTTPHAWRMAFLRYFPGQDERNKTTETSSLGLRERQEPDIIRSESRSFTRLTSLASWRSEYLLRTRLLRNVARGKPGSSLGSTGSSTKAVGKRGSAVLTYNSKLPWTVSAIHAVFNNGKKPPKVISGASVLGVSTMSDPTIGKVDKWGLEDPFSCAQLDEVFPNLEPYGLGEGPAATPNVIDVSQPYGIVCGEGFPGGRVYYRATNEQRGRYLGQETAIIDMIPDIPKIPELSEAICSVWIARSAVVPSLTQSMVGIMTGSTLGIVTTYSIRHDSSGPRYSSGEMTARWAICPGVPIIAIKVDDNLSLKRMTLRRVWAVVLNALGEVYYLKDTPTPPASRVKGEDMTRTAWMSGRSVSWELVGLTRRKPRPDEFDKNAVRGAYSPRSPSDTMNLSKEQIIAEAREIEKFLRHKPAHFRRVCEAWDMRRTLEVDFAGSDEHGSGENIVIITCGHDKDEPASIRRYSRRLVHTSVVATGGSAPTIAMEAQSPSIFGGSSSPQVATPPEIPGFEVFPPSQIHEALHHSGASSTSGLIDDWLMANHLFNRNEKLEITTSALDLTSYALLARFEDPLLNGAPRTTVSATNTPTTKHSIGDIPGKCARLFGIGTNSGLVVLWNVRSPEMSSEVQPLRTIQTDSPSISSLAVSALYLIHGGSDGLVQAWDLLASTLEPIRTLNARSSGRVPRHVMNANPALRHANYSAVGAIFLDPDPTILRGVLSFGTFLRYWAYSSTSQPTGRKRRTRHSDVHGRLASRRHGGTVSSYIAAEAAELRHERDHNTREQARLRSRFGVGLGDLTEEEAIRYAEMISQDSYLLDEQRRTSASDTGGSTADMGETASSTGSSSGVLSSTGSATPEPSLSGGRSPPGPHLPALLEEQTDDDDYEAQIQRALRLSLMEGVNDAGQSPRDAGSGEYEFPVRLRERKGKGSGARSASASPSTVSREFNAVETDLTPMVQYGESSRGLGAENAVGEDEQADLELALRLSMEEEERSSRLREQREGQEADLDTSLSVVPDAFPPLDNPYKGKGKGRVRDG